MNDNKICFDYALMIACDIANEVIDLCKNNKNTTKYNPKLLEYLKNKPNSTFYISSPIDHYDQIDDTNTEKRNDCNICLYVDDSPITLITTNYNIDDNQRLNYNYYPVDDEKFSDILSCDNFYLLNASDYGLYLVSDNDTYTISYPISENKNFMEDVKKLNIVNNKISKDVLDLELLNKTTLNINVKDYSNKINQDVLTSINNCLKNEENNYADCQLLGPIYIYQYYFSTLNNIEVCDYNVENDNYYFKLVKDNKVIGYISYDSFDEEVQFYDELNEADKIEKDIKAYYVNLVDVGFIYADKVIDEKPEEVSYSYLDKVVLKAIQEKIKKDNPSYNQYSLF